MPTIYQIAVIALLAAFIILFLGKTELRIKMRNWCDKEGITIVADMLECDFCLSFWICTCLALGFLVLGYEISFFIPFCAAPITRFLL